jgi:hypothetical protein
VALNGILLPSALVFLVLLVLLANDKQVLGPRTNSTAQNWVSGLIVWTVTTFSLAPAGHHVLPRRHAQAVQLRLRRLHGPRAGGRARPQCR